MKPKMIGEYIAERISELGWSYSQFANEIRRSRSCINSIVKRRYIYPELLQVINDKLKYDFTPYNVSPKVKKERQPEIKLIFILNVDDHKHIDLIINAFEGIKSAGKTRKGDSD